ncbi:MAG: DUF4476 domain-containing protein [Bacteroidia bacterium]
MKNNLLIAVLTVIGMITTAQVNASELNLKMFDRSLITVSIDNGPFTAPAPSVGINHIPEGYRLITVYSFNPQPVHCGNGQQLVFREMVYMPAMIEMNAAINRFGQFKVNNIIPKNNPAPACNTQYQNYNQNGYNNGYTQNQFTNYYGNGYAQPNTFNNSDFDALHNTVEQQSFDQTRLSIAKQAIQSRMLNTEQVADLMRLFSFESTKLDFAKYAYQHTFDKDRYYVINNEFSFSSSIDELVNYINRG